MKDEREGVRSGPGEGHDLRRRTREYALATIRLFGTVQRTPPGQVLGRQVLRSGTSVGAHYREACRARSDAEFVSKMESGLQELDETGYWLELLIESALVDAPSAHALVTETDELIRIFVAIVLKSKRRPRRLEQPG